MERYLSLVSTRQLSIQLGVNSVPYMLGNVTMNIVVNIVSQINHMKKFIQQEAWEKAEEIKIKVSEWV